MRFEEFEEKIVENMKSRVTDDYLVELKKIQKNNGLKLTGLIIGKKERNIYPTLYLETYFEKMRAGWEFEKIAEMVWQDYYNNAPQKDWDVESFVQWENASSRICVKVVNYEANKQFLEDVPYRKFCDLAVIYCVVVDIQNSDLASITIHNKLLQLWNKNEQDLYKLALENYEKLFPITFRNMEDIVKELLTDNMMTLEPDTVPTMVVATNKTCLNGAAVILFPEKLQKIADQYEKDLCILPSSIHELILIPIAEKSDVDELREIVQEVNREELRPEEVLSENVYLFNRKRGIVELCTKGEV